MSTPPPRIFVSHNSKDQVFAQRLAGDLRQAGATAWIYEADDSAGNIMQRVNEMLAQCDWLVLVLSPDAVASTYVQTEVFVALNRVQQARMRGVVPVVLRAVDLSHLPTWEALRRFDATSGAKYPAALAGVLRAVGIAPTTQPPTPQPATPQPPIASVSALRPPDPTPAPTGATPAYHLTPTSLYTLGFRGYSRGGVEFVLPPLCPVPGGVFTMGSDKTHDKQALDNETPQYPVEVASFAIGRHPVTVAEYACAVRAKAVREPPRYSYFTSGTVAPAEWRGGKKLDWAAQSMRVDHPVVNVFWDDAMAYCAWLAQVSGQAWRLPSEAEWEKAARWDPAGPPNQVARIYPWGDTFEETRANTSQGGPRGTVPVGSYPSGGSPCGAQDMAGNVWEWTSSEDKPYSHHAHDSKKEENSTEIRVLRGGAWNSLPTGARAACRLGQWRGGLLGNFGFRLALGPDGA